MSVVETFHHAEHAYFDAALMLITFLVAGRYLDQSMRRRTRAVAGNLAALKAETATKFVGADEICEVPIAAVQAGDIVLLRPGERSAVDGAVIEGQSKIDQSLITGETLPAKAGPGTAVYAGTLNLSGALRVRVSAAAEGTLLAEIARLLENAVQARSRYLQLADRASRLYAPVVHATALLTMIGWVAFGASWHDAIVTAIAVLIITCPCALGLAIPAVQTIVSGALFRSGVLLNSGDAVERLAEVDRVVFDKTGTLTLPELDVANAAKIPQACLRSGRPACARQPSSGRRRRGPGRPRKDAAGRRRGGGRTGRAWLSSDGLEVKLGQAVVLRRGTNSLTTSCAGIRRLPSLPSGMARPVMSLPCGSGCARMRPPRSPRSGRAALKWRFCRAIASPPCGTRPNRWAFMNGARASRLPTRLPASTN